MDNQSQGNLIRCIGDACRITGLTIEGPKSGAEGDPTQGPYATGIRLDGGGCVVDNCEIRNFPTDGVHVGAKTAAVHHNSIHDVARGVRIEQSSAVGGAGGSSDADCSPAMEGGN